MYWFSKQCYGLACKVWVFWGILLHPIVSQSMVCYSHSNDVMKNSKGDHVISFILHIIFRVLLLTQCFLVVEGKAIKTSLINLVSVHDATNLHIDQDFYHLKLQWRFIIISSHMTLENMGKTFSVTLQSFQFRKLLYTIRFYEEWHWFAYLAICITLHACLWVNPNYSNVFD